MYASDFECLQDRLVQLEERVNQENLRSKSPSLGLFALDRPQSMSPG
jgi:hypothetical protein